MARRLVEKIKTSWTLRVSTFSLDDLSQIDYGVRQNTAALQVRTVRIQKEA